jgi:hypothetical protein
MVKPRENRVPIMMSEDELRIIDDWRFENRVATRSSAIRQLCYRGLEYGKRFQEMESGIYAALIDLEKYVAEHPESASDDSINRLALALMKSAYVGLNYQVGFEAEMKILKRDGVLDDTSPARMLAGFVAHFGSVLEAIEMPIHPYFEEDQ